MQHLILGGARSGKSGHAQALAEASGRPVCIIATAEAGDDEMRQRILLHRQQRPSHWQVMEEPLALAQALHQQDSADACLLVDCLTLWLSNLLLAGEDRMQQEIEALFNILPRLQAQVIFVSNEVGQGIVPLGESNRRFVDEAGRLHQRLARQCDLVDFLVAGLVNRLKGAR